MSNRRTRGTARQNNAENDISPGSTIAGSDTTEKDLFTGFLLRHSPDGLYDGDELTEILHIIREYFDMDVAFIAEFVGDRHVFRYIDSSRQNEMFHPGFTSPLEQSYCHRIVNGEIKAVICDAKHDPQTAHLPGTDAVNIGSYLGVPVHYPDGVLYGTLCCFSERPDFSLCDRDQRFLMSFGEMAGRLLNKRLLSRSENQQVRSRIASVIQSSQLRVVYQPVVDIRSGEVAGVEALARFPDYGQRDTSLWFRDAAQVEMGQELELFAIRQAIRQFRPFSTEAYLALNASPDMILNGSLEMTLSQEHLPCPLVVEITEHTPIPDYVAFREALASLRQLNVKLAIDDVGAGFSSLQHILELDPDIIKLDISLVRNIHKDRIRHALARSLSVFASEIGCSIVAEGVEKQEELRCLKRLGVHRAQGFYLARPSAEGYDKVSFEG